MASADVIYNVIERRSNDEEDISLQKDFNRFVSKSNMYLWDLSDNEIQCHTVENSSNNEKYPEYLEHMKKNIHNSIFGSPRKEPHPLKRDFADTFRYYHNTQPKKKLFCRNKDYYLVKKSFTEGIQYVKQGKIHIYKAIAKPLDIYISDRPLKPKTLIINYDAYTISERILPGETKTLPSNTYYIIIAPCHAYFKKVEVDRPGVENATEISPSCAIDEVTSAAEDRNGSISSERPNQAEALSMLYGMSMFTQPSGSRDDDHGNSRHSMEFESVNEPEMVYDSASEGGRFFESDRESKRMKTSNFLTRTSTSQMEVALTQPSSNSSRYGMGLNSEIQAIHGTRIGNHCRAVFAVRKDNNIESYTLRSGSTFQVLQDTIVTGSFTIENDDMDPNVFEYHGDGQFIREIAKFKNGSMFENKLTVQNNLLNELRDPLKKKEKVVVNYFFEFAFKAIESAYEKFYEMRNTKMIGSCVPAIVPMSNARFCGAVSDTYEAKP